MLPLHPHFGDDEGEARNDQGDAREDRQGVTPVVGAVRDRTLNDIENGERRTNRQQSHTWHGRFELPARQQIAEADAREHTAGHRYGDNPLAVVLPPGAGLVGKREEDAAAHHSQAEPEELVHDLLARPVRGGRHALTGVKFVRLLGVEGRLGCEVGHSLRIMLGGGGIGNLARLR